MHRSALPRLLTGDQPTEKVGDRRAEQHDDHDEHDREQNQDEGKVYYAAAPALSARGSHNATSYLTRDYRPRLY